MTAELPVQIESLCFWLGFSFLMVLMLAGTAAFALALACTCRRFWRWCTGSRLEDVK